MIATEIASYTVGDEVEDFALPDLEEEETRLSDLAGEWTVLYFTTTWCPYCTAEAPYIEEEIVERFQEQGVRLVVIDVKEPAVVARRLPEQFGWKCPFLIDEAGDVSARFAPRKEGLSAEVAVINAHVVLDSRGIVRYAEYLNMERFDARVTSLVAALARLTGRSHV